MSNAACMYKWGKVSIMILCLTEFDSLWICIVWVHLSQKETLEIIAQHIYCSACSIDWKDIFIFLNKSLAAYCWSTQCYFLFFWLLSCAPVIFFNLTNMSQFYVQLRQKRNDKNFFNNVLEKYIYIALCECITVYSICSIYSQQLKITIFLLVDPFEGGDIWG